MAFVKIRSLVLVVAVGFSSFAYLRPAKAIPEFSRRYEVSCVACHRAFPRLSNFGESFASDNFKLPSWRETNTLDLGDEMLALPKTAPLAFRIQSFFQLREAEEVTPDSGPTGNKANMDFQTPYLIKLLSSSPVSENISYYFYGIFAEKGGNGEVVIEDAWLRHGDVFSTGVGLQAGQFQVSDLMFPREVRLTFQDFLAYRAAGVTYDRGVIFDRAVGDIDLAVGAVNGNGVQANYAINSPGYNRPDHMFDNDTTKNVFGRLGVPIGPVDLGLFALSGQQRARSGTYGDQSANYSADKRIYGVDLAFSLKDQWYWFGQVLWNEWDGFLSATPSQNYQWVGGFLGLDYIASDRWVYSGLWNFIDSGDFEDTDTIYKGLKANLLTLGASYYFMRNLKGQIEVTADMLNEDPVGPPFVGHQSKEHSFLMGLDLAL